MFLLVTPFVRDHSHSLWIISYVLIFFLGRNPVYQHLNLTFVINVMKFATITRFRPILPGTLVSIPAYATQKDERIYMNPNEFDGVRFSKLRENEGDTLPHLIVPS